jgi:two-component system nitrogen regulation sensor histidine kinase NtrY
MVAVREKFRNNARQILLVGLGALALLVSLELLLRKSRDFAPDFLASVLLYGITVLNLTLIFVLFLLLARNLVRALMERRRRVPGGRLRMRLLLVFLLMAVAPLLLLLFVGSDLIRQTVDRWFSVDVERILTSSQSLGLGLHDAVAGQSRVLARTLARDIEVRGLLGASDTVKLRRLVETRARQLDIDHVSVVTREGEVFAVMDPRLPPAAAPDPAAAEALARSALDRREAEATAPTPWGDVVRAGVAVRLGGGAVGAVVVSTLIPASVTADAKEVQDRYTKFRKAQSLQGPITSFYLSLYLFPALLVLFGAVWLSFYLARRMTIPLRLVAEGAERIAAGERRVRVDFAAGDDEFAGLIASFNRMSERLARSEEEVESTRSGLEVKNRELEERQRLIETVLETVGAGVLLTDSEGTVVSVNATAAELLDSNSSLVGRPVAEALSGPGREPVVRLVERLLSGRSSRQEAEVQLPWAGRFRHLAVTAVPLPGAAGSSPGVVLVLDDLTPLMKAQKVAAWGEVARKLAHEIKNPLTPVQLSAQRIRKAYLRQAPELDRIVTECTRAIEDEVEALRNLVDEFAQFARLPATRPVLASIDEVVESALSLYEGLFPGITLKRRLSGALPKLNIDVDQMKRVLLNLVDNAIEALGRTGTIVVETSHDPGLGRVRLVVADDGPGVRAADRDRLFVPDFSTKRKGGGLGLAIVSRIVQEHHGVIRVEDNEPKGARFVVELPAA